MYRMCVIFLIFSSLENSLTYGQVKIVQGEEAEPHEFPWMAMITDPFDSQLCGATLLTERHVITAGHCVFGLLSHNEDFSPMLGLNIRLGAHNKTYLEPGIQQRKIKQILRHPQYEPFYLKDFAIIELSEPVDFTNFIYPICLPSHFTTDYEGQQAIVAGWGKLSEGGEDSEVLEKAEVPIVSQAECYQHYQKLQVNVTDDMICAGENGKDACQLDSGGPLIWEDEEDIWHLIGIVSWGELCGSIEFPGVYSRISYALEWIQSVIGETKNVCIQQQLKFKRTLQAK